MTDEREQRMEAGNGDIEVLKALIQKGFSKQWDLIIRLETVLDAMTNFNGKQMLNNRDIRLQLRVCNRTLIRWRNSGKLSYFKLSGKIYFWTLDIYRFLHEGCRDENPNIRNNKPVRKSQRMESQSKVVMIERNKSAPSVKARHKCLQMPSILIYVYATREVQSTSTLEEVCELLQISCEEMERQRQKGYIRSVHRNGMAVYEITDILRLRNTLEIGDAYRKIDERVFVLEVTEKEKKGTEPSIR